MNTKFDLKTFKYFDLAEKEGKTREWFLEHEELYLEHVKKPMVQLITHLWTEIDDDLPGIEISPKKILRPVRPSHKIIPGENLVKHYINVNFSEKENSRFEWNPGIYLQLSSEKDENYLAVGLSMVSSRQLKLLREGFTSDYDRVHSILKNKKLRAAWGEFQGEKYARFPKSFDVTQKGAEYLWQKEFYFAKYFTRKEVISPDFSQQVVKDLKLIVPYLQWLRETVGILPPYLGIAKSSSSAVSDW